MNTCFHSIPSLVGAPFYTLSINYPELITDARVLELRWWVSYHLLSLLPSPYLDCNSYRCILISVQHYTVCTIIHRRRKRRKKDQSTGVKDRKDHKKQSSRSITANTHALTRYLHLLITFVFVSYLEGHIELTALVRILVNIPSLETVLVGDRDILAGGIATPSLLVRIRPEDKPFTLLLSTCYLTATWLFLLR